MCPDLHFAPNKEDIIKDLHKKNIFFNIRYDFERSEWHSASPLLYLDILREYVEERIDSHFALRNERAMKDNREDYFHNK